MASDKKVTLRSSDGQEFEVEETVARLSGTINNMIEDGSCSDGIIPVPMVTGQILSKVLLYCKKHAESPPDDDDKASKEDLKSWDASYIDVGEPITTLYDIFMAANFLDIKPLFDLSCQTVADMIKGKQPKEIRQKLGI